MGVGVRRPAENLCGYPEVVSDEHDAATDFVAPFRLVESLVNMWTKHPGPERARLPEHVADACIRVHGMPDSVTPVLRARSHTELRRYAAGG